MQTGRHEQAEHTGTDLNVSCCARLMTTDNLQRWHGYMTIWCIDFEFLLEGQFVELHHGAACVGNACKESHNTAGLGSFNSNLEQADAFTDLDPGVPYQDLLGGTGSTARCAIETSLTIDLVDQSIFPADRRNSRNGH